MPALIITRMDGEKFVIRAPGQPDITVEVWSRRLGKTAVRIVAPPAIEIIREELLDTQPHGSTIRATARTGKENRSCQRRN